jgi:ubiquinone/menaquinone biosynthesis C-methylase UbiE
MKYALFILAGIGLLFLIYLLVWRILSRFINLPCPPGYIFLLDSPLINRVAGAQTLIQLAGVKPGMHVLDAGCGPGRITIPVAEYLRESGKVTAFDMQPGMLAILNDRLAAVDLNNIEVIQGRFGDNLLGTNKYDRVFLVSVLGEIPDQQSALQEIHRALVPGGILSITEVLPDPHYQSQTAVAQLAESTGFQADFVNGGWRSFTMNLTKR